MKKVKMILMTVVVMLGASNLSAQKVSANKDNLAVNGYDVVNYFTTYTAAKGNKAHSTTHEGATFYFTNADNLAVFKKEPNKYMPQYGGFCAFAVAKMNKKVPADPATFKVDNGKLYLFYNDFWEGAPFNTIVPWISNEAEFKKMADANWSKM